MNNYQRNGPASPADRRIGDELRSTLAAYSELGPGYEQQIIDSFLDRIRPVLHPSPAPLSPSPGIHYRRHNRGRGLFVAIAILLGWLLVAGPLSGHSHRTWSIGYGTSVSPLSPPGISAPAQPAAPQLPGSSVQ